MTDFEHRHALQQGHEIAASDSYFEARPQIDTNDRRKVFQAGFERGWDRHAALVEAQQPAPSAAAFDEHGFRDWVLRNLPKGSIIGNGEWWADHLTAWAKRFVKAAPQPSPTPQADSAPLAAPADIVVLEAALRAIHQAIDLIGEPDTERLRTVRRVLRGAVVVAEDSTAPQADSQPAPVLDSLALMKVVMQADEALAGRCTRGTTNWAAAIGKAVQDAVLAARAPADSVTAPAGGVAYLDIGAGGYIDLGTDLSNEALSRLPKGRHVLIIAGTYGIDGYTPTQPAQAADSVLEDAARLDWLDQQCEAYGFQDIHEGNRWEISGAYANVREAIDAERAARKQGGAND